jgi:HSP20 family molecular chaperone IbpA
MNEQLFAGGDERFSRQYEYGDSSVVAVDLGAATDATVDVVGDSVILVAETATGTEETEFDLPSADADVATNNGVLTVTIPK